MSGQVQHCRKNISLTEVSRFYVWSNGASLGVTTHYCQQDAAVKRRKVLRKRTPENGYRKMVAVLYDIAESSPDAKEYLSEAIELWSRKVKLATDKTEKVAAETCLAVLRNLWDVQYGGDAHE